MIFFLFLNFFPYIHGDCLEFSNNQTVNECRINHIENPNFGIEYYYPQCLQCRIRTLIKAENIKWEDENQCLLIDLQCIQLIFNNTEIFEDFFQIHQQFIYDLFDKDHGTDQNTLHIIIKENTLGEINEEYIETFFPEEYQAYRALFIELHIGNRNIKLNRNLVNLTRLSMKIILNCGDEIKRIQTIYLIHNSNITLDSEQDLCASILIPSSTTIITTVSDQALSVSEEKSKDIVILIILLTSFLLCLLITFIICCLKYIKRHRWIKLPEKSRTPSELSNISMETPIEKPKLNIKSKPSRGMRAIQLLDDDI